MEKAFAVSTFVKNQSLNYKKKTHFNDEEKKRKKDVQMTIKIQLKKLPILITLLYS